MITSLTLAIMSKGDVAQAQKSFLDQPAAVQTEKTPQVPVVPVSSN